MQDPGSPRRPDVTIVDLVGGPEALELQLHDYDERWPAVYLEHRRRIEAALAGAGAGPGGMGIGPVGIEQVAIEHIGSTAVPGLAAKPIVDILVVVPDITAEEDYLEPLLAAGYRLRVREPGHRLVRTPERDVHVHVYERGAPAIDAYLLFRDRLRSSPTDRALYEATKRQLLSKRWSDMNDYADAKTDIIAEIRARQKS